MKILLLKCYTLNNEPQYIVTTLQHPVVEFTEMPDGSYLYVSPDKLFYKYLGKSSTPGAYHGKPFKINVRRNSNTVETIELKDYWYDSMIPLDILPSERQSGIRVLGLDFGRDYYSANHMTTDNEEIVKYILDNINTIRMLGEREEMNSSYRNLLQAILDNTPLPNLTLASVERHQGYDGVQYKLNIPDFTEKHIAKELPDGSFLEKNVNGLEYAFLHKSNCKGAFGGDTIHVTTEQGEIIALKNHWFAGSPSEEETGTPMATAQIIYGNHSSTRRVSILELIKLIHHFNVKVNI